MQIAPFTAGYLWKNETPYIETNDAQWTIKQSKLSLSLLPRPFVRADHFHPV
jgi:hypothetical protein